MKPMLAGQADLAKLQYPVYATPKLDGVRALVIDGELKSRSLKDVPNKHVNKRFAKAVLDGMDGELIYGPPAAPDVYRVTNSIVGSDDKEEGRDVQFYVFDNFFDPAIPYRDRHRNAKFEFEGMDGVVLVEHTLVRDEAHLLRLESSYLDRGYEGLILRAPDGPYKFGRSSTTEGWMLKLKRFTDSEAVVMSFYEEMHNGNEAKKNELGRTARSSAKAGKTGKDRLGGLVVKDDKLFPGVTFEVGTGFDAKTREELWAAREKLVGQVIKYKFFAVGVKDKPRHPVYLGPRHKWDM